MKQHRISIGIICVLAFCSTLSKTSAQLLPGFDTDETAAIVNLIQNNVAHKEPPKNASSTTPGPKSTTTTKKAKPTNVTSTTPKPTTTTSTPTTTTSTPTTTTSTPTTTTSTPTTTTSTPKSTQTTTKKKDETTTTRPTLATTSKNANNSTATTATTPSSSKSGGAGTQKPTSSDGPNQSNKSSPNIKGRALTRSSRRPQAENTSTPNPDEVPATQEQEVKSTTVGPNVSTLAPTSGQARGDGALPKTTFAPNPEHGRSEIPTPAHAPVVVHATPSPQHQPVSPTTLKSAHAPVVGHATPSPHHQPGSVIHLTIQKPTADNKNEGDDLSDELRKLGLDTMNFFRVKHGAKPLTLNPKLSKQAQAWAAKVAQVGQRKHSCLSGDTCDYGENAAYEPPHLNFTDAMTNGITAWYNEVKLYDFHKGGPITKGVIGHFTQLVWAASKEVGLGAVRSSKDHFVYIFAQYQPPGNYEGEYIQNVLPPVAVA